MAAQSLLLTDLYELTMLEAYRAEGMNGCATFEFFVRAMPAGRAFLVAAGLAQLVDYLTTLRVDPDELAWLAASGRFDAAFVDSLSDLAFTGDVDAMPEGTVFFADEPIVRVTAPLREAQLVESRAINLLHFETLVASKAISVRSRRPAARWSTSACAARTAPKPGCCRRGRRTSRDSPARRPSRRAARSASRCSARWRTPTCRRMPTRRARSRRSCARARATRRLLIDTYDTERAAHRVVALARRLAARGLAVQGVRIDSGDLGDARRARARDPRRRRLPGITIFASGNLDEYRLRDLVRAGAPIDGFGVGTRVNTSADAPYLDCGYKLQEYDGVPRRKRSAAKATWPGRKQVYRRMDAAGRWQGDVVTLVDDPVDGSPLLQPVMRGGRLVTALPSLEESRARLQRELDWLPAALKSIDPVAPPRPEISPSLARLAEAIDART